jgi:hypothetical protein
MRRAESGNLNLGELHVLASTGWSVAVGSLAIRLKIQKVLSEAIISAVIAAVQRAIVLRDGRSTKWADCAAPRPRPPPVKVTRSRKSFAKERYRELKPSSRSKQNCWRARQHAEFAEWSSKIDGRQAVDKQIKRQPNRLAGGARF